MLPLGPDPVMGHDASEDGPQARPRHRLSSSDRHLRRKPQAIRYLVYREALFPSAAYAAPGPPFDGALPPRDPAGRLVRLLVMASIRESSEIALASRLDAILDAGRLPDLAALEMEFATRTSSSSDVRNPRAKPR